MRWFRKRRKPAPFRPGGEIIDTSTPEGRARFAETFGRMPKVRDSPEPAPNPHGISLSALVLEEREEWYRGEST
jgi:hypothetical protein